MYGLCCFDMWPPRHCSANTGVVTVWLAFLITILPVLVILTSYHQPLWSLLPWSGTVPFIHGPIIFFLDSYRKPYGYKHILIKNINVLNYLSCLIFNILQPSLSLSWDYGDLTSLVRILHISWLNRNVSGHGGPGPVRVDIICKRAKFMVFLILYEFSYCPLYEIDACLCLAITLMIIYLFYVQFLAEYLESI